LGWEGEKVGGGLVVRGEMEDVWRFRMDWG
jgi:hypothetical protein